jgi:hypothetical protein
MWTNLCEVLPVAEGCDHARSEASGCFELQAFPRCFDRCFNRCFELQLCFDPHSLDRLNAPNFEVGLFDFLATVTQFMDNEVVLIGEASSVVGDMAIVPFDLGPTTINSLHHLANGASPAIIIASLPIRATDNKDTIDSKAKRATWNDLVKVIAKASALAKFAHEGAEWAFMVAIANAGRACSFGMV